MRFAPLLLSVALGFATGHAARVGGARLFQQGVETKSARLFLIHRSTNENVVAFDARFGPDGFDEKNPIDVYWIIGKGGGREELTGLERRHAFGISIEALGREEVTFHLVALPSRSITVRLGPREPRAITTIAGEEAYLASVFVATKDRALIPGIRHVDLRGITVDGLRTVRERITP